MQAGKKNYGLAMELTTPEQQLRRSFKHIAFFGIIALIALVIRQFVPEGGIYTALVIIQFIALVLVCTALVTTIIASVRVLSRS